MDNNQLQEGHNQIASAIEDCKSSLDFSLALRLIYELANYYYIYGDNLLHGYGNQYDDDINALQNDMRELMSMCVINSVNNTTVNNICLGFDKIVTAHLANFYNDRSKNGQ